MCFERVLSKYMCTGPAVAVRMLHALQTAELELKSSDYLDVSDRRYGHGTSL